MTDEEDFLARWSRRKREIAKAEADAKPVQEPKAEPAQKAEPEFDIASLPPIESINALTDVTAFLREGVPAELTRAALRRVWTADPAIRDFVGLAENAWDFTDPAAMPGFGPLESTDEVRQMIASIVDQIGHAAEYNPEREVGSSSDSKEVSEDRADDQPMRVAVASEPTDENSHDTSDHQVLLQSNKEDTALQHDVAERVEVLPKLSRRTHGGALPQ